MIKEAITGSLIAVGAITVIGLVALLVTDQLNNKTQPHTPSSALVCGQVGGIPHIVYSDSVQWNNGAWVVTTEEGYNVTYQKSAEEACVRLPAAMAKDIEDQVAKFLKQQQAKGGASGEIKVSEGN